MKNSSHNIPVLVVSNNRHHYLDRILTYYWRKQHEEHLIIADGSEKKWPGAVDSDLTYLHLHGLTYRERLLAALKKTQSDLVVLAADDDFLVPRGIKACVQFLRQNPDYSCAQGLFGRFVIRNGQVSYSEQRPWLQSIVDDEPLSRIKKGFIPKYSPYVYAVHRRESLEKVLSLTRFSDDEYLLVFEQLLTYIACLTGKCKIIPVIYDFREMENKKIWKIEKYTMVARALLGFKEAALGFIPDGNQRNAFTQVIDKIANIQMEVYFSAVYEEKNPSPKHYPSLRKSIRQSLSGLRSLIKASLGRTKDSVGKNACPLRPYSDQVLEEFLIIDDVIKGWAQQQYTRKGS